MVSVPRNLTRYQAVWPAIAARSCRNHRGAANHGRSSVDKIGCAGISMMVRSKARSTKGRIQKSKTNRYPLTRSSLQGTVGPYRSANRRSRRPITRSRLPWRNLAFRSDNLQHGNLIASNGSISLRVGAGAALVGSAIAMPPSQELNFN